MSLSPIGIDTWKGPARRERPGKKGNRIYIPISNTKREASKYSSGILFYIICAVPCVPSVCSLWALTVSLQSLFAHH